MYLFNFQNQIYLFAVLLLIFLTFNLYYDKASETKNKHTKHKKKRNFACENFTNVLLTIFFACVTLLLPNYGDSSQPSCR